jgi:hypothetical protein
MKEVLDLLGIANTLGTVTLSRIVTSQERNHVTTTILILRNAPNPTFGVLALKKPNELVLDAPGVSNKVLTRQWSYVDHLIVDGRILLLSWDRNVHLPHNVRERDSSNSRDHR